MISELFRNWWQFAVRGVLAIVFGIMALVWPEPTKVALVVLFGVFVLLNGTLTVVTAIKTREVFKNWWMLLVEGIIGIVFAVLTFIQPETAATLLLYVIATWAILTGILEILAALELRNLIPGEWATFLFGVLSIVLGVLLFAYPEAGMVSIVWMIGLYAIAAGIMEIVFAFHLRKLGNELEQKQTSPAKS